MRLQINFKAMRNSFIKPHSNQIKSSGPFNNAQTLLLSNLYEMHQKFLRQLEDRLVAWTNETRTLNISDVLARNLCLFTVSLETRTRPI